MSLTTRPSDPLERARPADGRDLSVRVRRYWNQNVHDRHATEHPPGSAEFFRDLDAFRFAKLAYLPQRVNFGGYRDRNVLEIGCGAGIDLLRFARGGARVIGVDDATTPLALARLNFEGNGLAARFVVADAGSLPLSDRSVDLVYCHGVLQYAANPASIVREAKRVLRPGGEAIFMVYNRRSWMAWISRALRTPLEHEDAPIFRMYSIEELDALLGTFPVRRIETERFPQRTTMKRGTKAMLFNGIFVPIFSLVPRRLIRRYGWHLMAYCRVGSSAPTGGA
jgi:SAM-dependent methyltransferase